MKKLKIIVTAHRAVFGRHKTWYNVHISNISYRVQSNAPGEPEKELLSHAEAMEWAQRLADTLGADLVPCDSDEETPQRR